MSRVRSFPSVELLPRWSHAAVLFAALACAVAGAGPARAEFTPQYFFFDRALWSADSRQALIVGRYFNDTTHETLEDTLLVDIDPVRLTCASPSINEFTLSRDRRRLVGLGRWGLYDHDLRTAITREVTSEDPFQPNQVVSFGYDKAVDAIVIIRCNASEPEVSGVWSYPLDGRPAELMLADPYCGAQALNFWQLHRREVAPTDQNLPARDRPTEVPGVNAFVVQTDDHGHSGVALRQGGRDSVICADCRAEFVSWPPEGGRAVIGTAPENRLDSTGPGAVWLIRAAQPPLKLRDGRADRAAWGDSVTAYCTLRPGRMIVVDAAAGRTDDMRLSAVPEWGRHTALVPAELWTIRLGDELWPDYEAARTEALRYREALGIGGYAVDRGADRKSYRLSVGAWPDSMAAARQLAVARKTRAAAPATSVAPVGEARVERRPAASMQGAFDFGSLLSPDGKWRLFYRTHPHMFLPYLANEVWLEPAGGGKRKLLVRATATFSAGASRPEGPPEPPAQADSPLDTGRNGAALSISRGSHALPRRAGLVRAGVSGGGSK